MAITIRPGTSIRDFSPDDTADTFYLSTEYNSPTMQEILDAAQEKWGPDIRLENLRITAEHIHTQCLGYDRYDPSDYTNFLVICYTPNNG